MADEPDGKEKEKEGESDSGAERSQSDLGPSLSVESGSKSKQSQENIPASSDKGEQSSDVKSKSPAGTNAQSEAGSGTNEQGQPEDEASKKRAASEMEERIKNMAADAKTRIKKEGTNRKESEDEWIRFRLLVHIPLIALLSIVALFGTVTERGLGIFCGFLSSQCEEIAGKCEGFLQTALLKTGAALAFVSRHSIAMGKALRESSLMMVYFWLAYWKMLDLGGNGPVAIIGFLKEAFEGKAVIDKPSRHEKTD